MSSFAGFCLLFIASGAQAGAVIDRLTLNAHSAYPEGPLVDGASLYYAEMGNDRVMRWDGRQNSVVWTRKGCGPTSVSKAGEGVLNVLCHREESVVRISASGETVEVFDRDSQGKPFRTPNASVNDRKGGVYFSSSGSFSPKAEAEGAVLYLDARSRLRRVAEDIHYANGVALTPDGKQLFVSEHLSRHILVFDVAEDGSLSGKRIFVALEDLIESDPGRGWEAGPDGLAVDRDGNVFVAEYGAGRFMAISPGGELLATIAVPDQYITGLALDSDERRIFVTAPTSRLIPMNGNVYSIANPLFHRD